MEPGLATILLAAVTAGWIVGPCAGVSAATDIGAAVRYFVVAYVLQSLVGTMTLVWQDLQGGQAAAPGAIGDVVGLWLARVLYLPVFALFLSPAALTWVVVVRLVRARLFVR
jgi:hypothetical protein